MSVLVFGPAEVNEANMRQGLFGRYDCIYWWTRQYNITLLFQQRYRTNTFALLVIMLLRTISVTLSLFCSVLLAEHTLNSDQNVSIYVCVLFYGIFALVELKKNTVPPIEFSYSTSNKNFI